MDLIVKYIIENEVHEKELGQINHIRLYKKIYLLFELAIMKKDIKTNEFKELNRQSNIKWKF